MELCGFLLYHSIIILLTRIHFMGCSPESGQLASEERIVNYNVAKQADNDLKFKIILKGTKFTDKRFCRIMKSSDEATTFEEITSCENNDSGAGSTCSRKCVGSDDDIAFNKLSPRTKYIYIFDGDTVGAVKEAQQKQGGKVFGLSTRLLLNPRIAVSTDGSQKLTFTTKTCPNVACPIKYGNIKYVDGTAGANCDTNNSNNAVDFDLLIPHYEMKCVNLPSFFYHMPNKYMKDNIDVYKPQFYVAYKSESEKTKYILNFQNSLSGEICHFNIKSALDADKSQPYVSKCGGTGDHKCYAPCDDVELTLNPSKEIVKILIQTREHKLTESGSTDDGYTYNKFAIFGGEVGLLSVYTKEGVTFDAKLFKPDSGTSKFTQCTLSHYPAGKLKPSALADTNCDDTSKDDGQKCNTGCISLNIKGLANGTPYVIEIASTGITDPESFKEYIFIRTDKGEGKNFQQTVSGTTETSISLKVIDGEAGKTSDDPTCAYLISPAKKDEYYEAECEDTNPCRGLCQKEKKIINLEAGTTYDIIVVAHKDYGAKKYADLTTSLSTLTLTSEFTTKGFVVSGKLSTDYPWAECQYTVLVKNGNEFEKVFVCPATIKTNPLPPSKPILKASKATIPTRTVNPKKIVEEPKTVPTCDSLPLCSLIRFEKNYNRSREYKVTVKAVGKSEEVEISINANPPTVSPDIPVVPTDAVETIVVSITRTENDLKVTTVLPSGSSDESICKWLIQKPSKKSKRIVKSCVMEDNSDCTTFPLCKEFTVSGLPDTSDYYVTVFLADDPTIFGSARIERGERGTAQSSTTTIIVAVVVVAIVAGLGGAGFYFGYWKKRN